MHDHQMVYWQLQKALVSDEGYKNMHTLKESKMRFSTLERKIQVR